jgi:serine/threonine protein kinase
LFKPIKKIGKGNFASVYLVVKYEDKQKYAVKAFSKEGTYQ